MADPKIIADEATLAKMVAEAVAAAMAATVETRKAKSKGGRPKLSDEEKAKNRAKTDAETVKNFKAEGYKDVQPRINVMTYLKWVENGRRVKKGQKAIKCGSFPLFHVEQTEPLKPEGTVH